MFSPSVTSNTNLIFVTCNGLKDAKKLILNVEELKALPVKYLTKN